MNDNVTQDSIVHMKIRIYIYIYIAVIWKQNESRFLQTLE